MTMLHGSTLAPDVPVRVMAAILAVAGCSGVAGPADRDDIAAWMAFYDLPHTAPLYRPPFDMTILPGVRPSRRTSRGESRVSSFAIAPCIASRAAGALVAAAMIVACAGPSRPAATPAPQAAAPSTAELEAIYRARRDSALTRFTEADVRFMTGMIGHHGQALVMARLAATHGASPSVQTLCARIINAQQDEIATMQQWLRIRGQPVPAVHIMGASMMVHGPEYAMRMPGMLTDEQLAELDRARGPDFDRLFLTSMIQHHGGAVTMVHDLFAMDGAAQDEAVFKLASDIQVDQITEIARMQSMLDALTTAERGR